MPQLYNAGELFTIIKMANAKDIEDYGSDDASQQTAVFYFISISLQSLAAEANITEYSDAKAVTSDGFITFTKSGQDIADMFMPKEITYLKNGILTQLTDRTSDTADYGWWREADNLPIHIRGFNHPKKPLPATDYTLKYVRYPKKITLDSDVVEIPAAGNDMLIKRTISLLKYGKNSYAGADFLDTKAKESMDALVKASKSATGNKRNVV